MSSIAPSFWHISRINSSLCLKWKEWLKWDQKFKHPHQYVESFITYKVTFTAFFEIEYLHMVNSIFFIQPKINWSYHFYRFSDMKSRETYLTSTFLRNDIYSKLNMSISCNGHFMRRYKLLVTEKHSAWEMLWQKKLRAVTYHIYK